MPGLSDQQKLLKSFILLKPFTQRITLNSLLSQPAYGFTEIFMMPINSTYGRLRSLSMLVFRLCNAQKVISHALSSASSQRTLKSRLINEY